MFLLCIGSLGGELDCFFQTSYPNPLLQLCTSHGESCRWQFSAGSGLSRPVIHAAATSEYWPFYNELSEHVSPATFAFICLPKLLCQSWDEHTHTPPPPGLQQSVLGYLSLGICSSGCFPVVPISWSLKHCLNQVTLKWGRKKKQREKDEKVELTFVSLFWY